MLVSDKPRLSPPMLSRLTTYRLAGTVLLLLPPPMTREVPGGSKSPPAPRSQSPPFRKDQLKGVNQLMMERSAPFNFKKLIARLVGSAALVETPTEPLPTERKMLPLASAAGPWPLIQIPPLEPVGVSQ